MYRIQGNIFLLVLPTDCFYLCKNQLYSLLYWIEVFLSRMIRFPDRGAHDGNMSSSHRTPCPEQFQGLADEVLCRRIAAGSHEAFLALFDRYWDMVFALAHSVLRDKAEAEDLAQGLFVEFHRNMLQFDETRGSLRTLLLRFAYTKAIDQRRRLQSRHFYSNVQIEEVDPEALTEESCSIHGLSMEEAGRLIEQTLLRLDPKQRATVHAYYFRGLSVHEIATEFGESFGNVRHYLYRGLEKMRKLIVTGNQAAEPEEREGTMVARLLRKSFQAGSFGGARCQVTIIILTN